MFLKPYPHADGELYLVVDGLDARIADLEGHGARNAPLRLLTLRVGSTGRGTRLRQNAAGHEPGRVSAFRTSPALNTSRRPSLHRQARPSLGSERATPQALAGLAVGEVLGVLGERPPRPLDRAGLGRARPELAPRVVPGLAPEVVEGVLGPRDDVEGVHGLAGVGVRLGHDLLVQPTPSAVTTSTAALWASASSSRRP